MNLILKYGLSLVIFSTIIKSSKITLEEKEGLRQLREKLVYILYEPYMKSDFYIINFLRAKRNDVTAAADMLKKAQNWRIRQRMDRVLNETEPWDGLLKVLPYRADGLDRAGCPVIEVPVGKWDTRKMVVAGKGDLYVHHITRVFEDAFQRVRLAHNKDSNITQWQILYDLTGYNSKQHACLACIPRQSQFQKEYEANYPLRMKTAWVVNTPKSFESLLNILKTFMSPETKEGLQIYGLDKSEWEPKAHQSIDPSQLLPIFGGTKI